MAGTASGLPRRRFNFVFAKDVLEHLHDPEAMIDEIAAAATEDALLAIDVEDKGRRIYQHVRPNLAPLQHRLEERGWEKIGSAGVVTLFTRR